MRTLIHLGVLTVTVLLASRIIAGVKVKNAPAAVLVAVVFAALNWVLAMPVRFLLFLPALLTFGLLWLLVPLIVNTVALWVTDKALHVFEIQSVRALVLMAALITGVSAAFRFIM